MPHSCSLTGCKAVATGGCAACGSAWYCGKEHQKKAYRLHKLWCKLLNTILPPLASAPKVTFLGQSSSQIRELSQTQAAQKAVLVQRPGWRALPSTIQVEDASKEGSERDAEEEGGGSGESYYFHLASAVNMAALRKQWPLEDLVIPTRQCHLQLSYCLGTQPCFLLEAQEGKAGFTTADLIAATAQAYQWCYEREDAVTTPPSMGGMLNRGPTYGANLFPCVFF